MEASSIIELQRHSCGCGKHKSSPSLRPTATLTASSSNCRPHEAIGRANSQSPLCCAQAAKKEARLWDESSDDSTTALSANTPGRSKKWLSRRQDLRNVAELSRSRQQAWLKEFVVRGNTTRQDVGLEWHGAGISRSNYNTWAKQLHIKKCRIMVVMALLKLDEIWSENF